MDAIVSSLNISNLLQLFSLEQKSILLEIQDSSNYGYILLQNGEVWDAQYQNLRGEEALYTILQEDKGLLNSLPVPTSVTRTIELPLQALLLNSAQIEDKAHIMLISNITTGEANKRLTTIEGFQGTILTDISGQPIQTFPSEASAFFNIEAFSHDGATLIMAWKELIGLDDSTLFQLYDSSTSIFVLHAKGGYFFIIGIKSSQSAQQIAESVKKALSLE